MSIRILLAEDQRLVREALGALLSREPDIELVGEAATGPDAVSLAQETRPDVLVLDISLPGLDGMEVAKAVHAGLPAVRIIALSVHQEPYYVREMLKAGATGYVDKSSALAELVRAIRLVMQDKVYLSPNVTRHALSPHARVPDASAISQRERQVLALLAQGMRSPQIARQLGISAATVEVHRRNMMRKLGLHTVAELTRYAVRDGLVSP
jgi:two-component system NarL family response regulator